ncbi:MAG: 5-(carboxyamino)imidazole ribonucleotide synthase [Pseudomonadota bacterium]
MRVGIIGGGQLGQMLGYAGHSLNIDCEFLDPSPAPPAASAGPVLAAAFDDTDAILELAKRCDVLSYEFENVPVDALAVAADVCPVYPPLDALRQAQDRLSEKRLFESLDIALPQWHAVDRLEDLLAAAQKLGLPLVLKTRRLGYDGKGQFLVQNEEEFETAWQQLGGSALIAEQWIPFDYEVSAIAARGIGGETTVYPLTNNHHAGGILRYSRAPVEAPELQREAAAAVCRMLERLDYVGVTALELFVLNGRILANEFAPRVHNSGHWTIEGTSVSQFANHLLAVTGQTPVAPGLKGHAGMLNLIGELPAAARDADAGGAVLHDYGKSPRPGRKLGHMTLIADSAAERDARLGRLAQSVTGSTFEFGTVQ